MPIAKITGHGLLAIAFAVALLWACVIADRTMSRRAQVDRVRVMRDFQHFVRQQRSQPVVSPIPLHPERAVVNAG